MPNTQKKILKRELFGIFFACPQCGRAIVSEMARYFTCPNCKKALCKEDEIKNYDNKYCGNCGFELSSAKDMALALVKDDN